MIALIFGGAFLLGVSILVHELGHMLMGRLVGIRAEVFSFGYGRGIWKKKIGYTTYQVTAIPLGGYVKYYGDDPSDGETTVPGGFFSAPPLVRIIPVIGGPLFNLILGFLLFLGLSSFSGLPPAIVQIFEETGTTSPAYRAGLRDGDVIEMLDGKPVRTFQDVQKIVMLSAGKDVVFGVRRGEQSMTFTVQPDLDSAGRASVGIRQPGERLIQVDYPARDLWSYRFGRLLGRRPDSSSVRALDYLNDGDILLSVQGVKPRSTTELQELLGRYHGQPVEVHVRRQTLPWLAPWFTTETTVTVPTRGEYRIDLRDVMDLKYGARVGDFALASMAGEYQKALGDIRVGGEPAGSFEHLYERFVTEQTVRIEIGEGPAKRDYEATVKATKIGLIGFRPGSVVHAVYSTGAVGASAIFENAVSQTVDNILLYPAFVSRLISGRLSFIENTMGPVGMMAVAGIVIKADLRDYFQMMASVSIALMVMNLLPFPVVDGGHVVVFLIEAITRKPVSPVLLDRVYRFGFAVLLFFGAWVMYKDLIFVIGL